jgi:hypothetical protein
MKTSETFNKKLIAPCGINCGTCIAFLREKNKCFGCRIGSEKKAITREMCIIKNCNHFKNTNSVFCYDCETFPCKRIKQLDKRYSTKYRSSLIQNLLAIKKTGMKKHLENEIIKWTCTNCGSILSIHRENCQSCGKEKSLQ